MKRVAIPLMAAALFALFSLPAPAHACGCDPKTTFSEKAKKAVAKMKVNAAKMKKKINTN